MLWRTAEIDQRRHLDQRDRPDQVEPCNRSTLSRPPIRCGCNGQPAAQFVRWQKKSIQTIAPVAAIDRVDLSESRAWSTPR